ncbi:uridine diphosphate-N-acetylglucosamine-binding protein YvcK [Aeromicrobium sp. CFBP 8757]|uniref:gluconeogenesis factor YvcK family protein n=1 Tax=Aeromicrobium sp. CFBP 8757 TaxID=2775288 RepID=UPI0035301872
MIARPARPERPERFDGDLRVVSLGGGHGLAASLSALRRLTTELTGVVTVADNGGSSGRLRQELGGLPPGDLRMALAALCGDDEWGRTWAGILQHRFSSDGPLDGHAVGNLLIAAIWDQLGDQVAGLDLVGDLLGAQGRVLPMADVPLDIEADVHLRSAPDRLTVVRGQVEVASTDGQVISVRLDPSDPPACPEAVRAVESADWVVVGPGSWFTSIMPTLLVPGLRDVLISTPAKRALVLNLTEQHGETEGLSPTDHLDVLAAHAPELRLDAVIADTSLVDDRGTLEATARALGARLFVSDLATGPDSDQHDPARLAAAFGHVMRQA